MDINQTVEFQNGSFWRREYLIYVFDSFCEYHYLKRKNPYYSLGLLQQPLMISNVDHQDFSEWLAQAY